VFLGHMHIPETLVLRECTKLLGWLNCQLLSPYCQLRLYEEGMGLTLKEEGQILG
jgi:hypothetical protein